MRAGGLAPDADKVQKRSGARSVGWFLGGFKLELATGRPRVSPARRLPPLLESAQWRQRFVAF